MARAASSLPVPLSPVKSTVLSLGAARRILAKTLLHGRGVADDELDALPVGLCFGRRFLRGPLRQIIQGLLDHRLQVVDAERLHQVVQGPVFDALHRPLNGGEAGDHDDLGPGVILAESLQHLHAVQVRHLDVQQDDGVGPPGHHLQGRQRPRPQWPP